MDLGGVLFPFVHRWFRLPKSTVCYQLWERLNLSMDCKTLDWENNMKYTNVTLFSWKTAPGLRVCSRIVCHVHQLLLFFSMRSCPFGVYERERERSIMANRPLWSDQCVCVYGQLVFPVIHTLNPSPTSHFWVVHKKLSWLSLHWVISLDPESMHCTIIFEWWTT